MAVAEPNSEFRTKLAAEDKLPVAVLATPEGTVIGKLENKNGMLRVEELEKLPLSNRLPSQDVERK